MNPRLILFGAENRRRLLMGADTFARAVCVTYGPHGRVVVLDRAAGLLSTKDGVTVAREIDLPDPVANLACQTFKTACINVNDQAGDGTTTTACIAAAILREGCRLVAAGHNPVRMAEGIRLAAQYAVDAVLDLSRPIETQEQLEKVALVASNGDREIAENMAEAVMAVGKNGTVSIEDGHSVETVLVFKEGMEIDRGAASMHFLQGANERLLDGPLVACVAATLKTVEDVLSICEEATTLGGRPLLLVCENITGEALQTLVMNDANKEIEFEFVAVLAPGNFDRKADHLGDIAALAGADLIDPKTGGNWTQWDRNWFGALRAAKIERKKSTLTAYDEASEVIQQRVAEIKATRQHATSQFDIDRLNERVATLEGGLCIMQIGAHTELALKEKRARVEDALGAVQGALEEGIIPGGGAVYVAAHQAIRGECPVDDADIRAGWLTLERALLQPVMVLASNAGFSGPYTAEKLRQLRAEGGPTWLGWDALKNEFRDFATDDSVIDPTRVAVAVIEASASAASVLLTSEASVSEAQARV